MHFCGSLLLLKPHTPFHDETILQTLSCYVTYADLFFWGLQSLPIFRFPSLTFCPHKLTYLKQECVKTKQNKTPPTSSNFLTIKKHDHIISLHCIHIPNLDSERGTPAKLGRPGEKGWLGFCCPAGVFAGCGANCRAKQTLRPHFKLLPERCC